MNSENIESPTASYNRKERTKRNDGKRDVNNTDDIITQSIPIPEYKMGWIIGKRGTYINQLAKKSGASLGISDSKSTEYGTVWKYVQITGTGRAVDRAKKLLHIRLERLEPREEVDGATGNNETSTPLEDQENLGEETTT